MRRTICSFLAFVFAYRPIFVQAKEHDSRQRLIVTTDLGGTDPDDTESMIHLLVCSNMVDIEGIISSQVWSDYPDRVGKIKEVVGQFCEALPNLSIHAQGYPSASYLMSIVKQGQLKSNMDGVGEGKDSPGSEHIIACVDKADRRPVWIAAWGGMNNVAQALWKVSQTRTPEELRRFMSRIRIYDVLGQDDAGAWIAHYFPDILYIRNKSVYGWPLTDEWVREHIIGCPPLGKYYPMRQWAFEGDSPSFMFLLDNGLNAPNHIDYGGWGGRFSLQKEAGIRGMDFIKKSGKDEIQYGPYYMHPSAPEGIEAINRWQQHIWNDFAARMQWAGSDSYDLANHHPVAVVGGDHTRHIIFKKVKAGRAIRFDASKSSDPDGHPLSFKWSIYEAPSTYHGHVDIDGSNSAICTVHVPADPRGKTLHLILEVTDSGTPALTSYRRVVIQVK